MSPNLLIITINKGNEMAGTVNPHCLQNVKWFFLVKVAVCVQAILYTFKIQSAMIVIMEFLALCLQLLEILIVLVLITFVTLCVCVSVFFCFVVFLNGIKGCYL